MKVSTTRESGVPVLHLEGSLDARTAAMVEAAFKTLWESGEYRAVLDCTGLRYVSSAGLQTFLVAGKIAGANRGRLAFCGLAAFLGEIFAMTQFDKVFPVYGSVAEAVCGVQRES